MFVKSKTENQLIQIDTRLLTSVFLSRSSHELPYLFCSQVPTLLEYYEYLDKRFDRCKIEFMKFYAKYRANIPILEEKIQERLRRSHEQSFDTANLMSKELLEFVVHTSLTPELLSFLEDELTNTNILGSLSENLDAQLNAV